MVGCGGRGGERGFLVFWLLRAVCIALAYQDVKGKGNIRSEPPKKP